MSGEVKVQRGITIRSLLLGVVSLVILLVVRMIDVYTKSGLFAASMGYVGVQGNQTWMYNFWTMVLLAMFLPIFIMSLLPKNWRPTPQEYTVWFIMVAVAMPMTMVPIGVAISGFEFFHRAVIIWQWFVPAQLPWMSPLTGPWTHMNEMLFVNGGFIGRPFNVAVPIHWDWYAPMIIYEALQVITLGSLCMFLGAILRKQYIATESLPFPNAVAGTALITQGTTPVEGARGWWSQRPALLRNKWLWLGALLAQVLLIPGYIFIIMRTLGLGPSPFKAGTSADIIIPLMPITVLWTDPSILGFSLFMPTDILLSYFIAWIVFVVILTNALWMAGVYPPPPATANLVWYVSRIRSSIIPMNPDGIGLRGIAYGVFIAGAIYPLWVHRKHVVSTIKAIWSKPPSELEKDEVAGYKWLYLGAILSFIAYIAVYAITPAVLWIGVLSIILAILWWTGGARMIAETGGWGGTWTSEDLYHPSGWWSRLTMLNLFGPPTPGGGPENAKYFYTINMSWGYYQYSTTASMPMPIILDAFAIAHVTRTRTRDVFIAGVISLILTMIICPMVLIWLFYSAPWSWAYLTGYGGAQTDAGFRTMVVSRGTPYGTRGYWYGTYGAPTGPDLPPVLATIILGIVLGIAIFAIKTRYPRFIFSPWGIVLWTLADPTTYANAFFLTGVALVVKYIVIKVYGAEMYQRKIVPLALGLIIGCGIFYLIDFGWYMATAVKYA